MWQLIAGYRLSPTPSPEQVIGVIAAAMNAHHSGRGQCGKVRVRRKRASTPTRGQTGLRDGSWKPAGGGNTQENRASTSTLHTLAARLLLQSWGVELSSMIRISNVKLSSVPMAASFSTPRTYGGSIWHPGRTDELVMHAGSAANSHPHRYHFRHIQA